MQSLYFLQRNKYQNIIVSTAMLSSFLSCSRDRKVDADSQDKFFENALVESNDSSKDDTKKDLNHFILDENRNFQDLNFNFLFDQSGQQVFSYMRLTDSRYPSLEWLYLLDNAYFSDLDLMGRNHLSTKKINFEKVDELLAKNREIDILKKRISILQSESKSLETRNSDHVYILNQEFLDLSLGSLESLKTKVSNVSLNQWLDLASKSQVVHDALSLNVSYSINQDQFQTKKESSNPFLRKFLSQQEEDKFINEVLLKNYHPSQSISYVEIIQFMARNSLEPREGTRLENDFRLWVNQSIELVKKMAANENRKLQSRKEDIAQEMEWSEKQVIDVEAKIKLLVEEIVSKS